MKKVPCRIEQVNANDGWNYFFGYYDKCPWNKTQEFVLAHRVKFLDHFPYPDDEAELGIINVATKQFQKFAATTAWNWQQGCQMQWIDYMGEECVIYNVRKGNEIHSIITNPFSKKEVREFDTSIYTVSSHKQVALTLNYARLYDTRKDYGISGLKDVFSDINAPEEDGIYLLDLNTGRTNKIISMHQLSQIGGSELSMYKQRVNHIMFNPSGTRFCFLHRYNRTDGICQSRLFTANLDGTDVRLLFEGMISHYDWKNDNTILAWAGMRKLIGSGTNRKHNPMTLLKRCLKPIYYSLGKPRILMRKIMGDSFYLITDSSDMKNNHERIGGDTLYCDGHCTYSPDKCWILTDGYTDSDNCLPLFLYKEETGDSYEIGRYQTPKYLDGELRVDLHPRFNQDGSLVLIDSAMSDKRGMYVVNVSRITKSK